MVPFCESVMCHMMAEAGGTAHRKNLCHYGYLSCARVTQIVGVSGRGHRPSGLKEVGQPRTKLSHPAQSSHIFSSVSHPSGHVHTIFAPVPDSRTTFRSTSISIITSLHKLQDIISENDVY